MLIDRIFNGNDAVYGLTVQAVDGAIAQHGADKAVGFPHTAYCLPCYYAVTGVKVKTLGEMKEALGVVKTLMTREQQLDDALMSGVATALCAEFIEALKYLDGAEPYSEPCYGHLTDSIIREMGVPLVTGDIPGVAVILGSAPTAQEGVDLIKSYQAQGILVTLVGGIIDQAQELGLKMGYNVRIVPLGKETTEIKDFITTIDNNGSINNYEKTKEGYTLFSLLCDIVYKLDILYVIFVFVFIFKIMPKMSGYNLELKRVLKEYDKMIVNVNSMPELGDLQVMEVSNFDELVDAKKNLNKPIMYFDNYDKNEVIFVVKSDSDAFVYIMNKYDK